MNRMRFVAFGATGVYLAVTMVFAPQSASASLDGPCQASGTLQADGRTIDAATVDEVSVPHMDDVAWKGKVAGAKVPRDHHGEVQIKFPIVGAVTVGDWDSTNSSTVSNKGTYHYDLPTLLAGVKIPVSGAHHEAGIDCSGTVVVQIDGTSPLAWVSLVVTALLVAVNVGLVMRARAV